jgi:SAM-dependent methyltransferase
MHWKPDELNKIETCTLGHYNDHAQAYWEGTQAHDVAENYKTFLAPFPPGQVLDILDFGCGPGRDLHYFKAQGHRPVGLDGSAVFCRMAREHAGCQVLEQSFLHLALPPEAYDGIFAHASLFHIPSQMLPRVLNELHDALRPGGILFSSNPRGSDEGWSGERYGHYMQFDVSKTYLEAAGFEVMHHYYRPAGKPLPEQPWLAIVSRSKSK